MPIILGILLRHGLAALAGILAASSGGLDAASIGGALSILASVAWSYLQKRGKVSSDNPFK